MMPADTPMREDAMAEAVADAVAWAVRSADPDFAEWDAFTAWLEADPARAAAYDRVAVAATDAAAVLALVPQPANDDADAGRWTRRRWLGGALAAALAVVAVFALRDPGPAIYETAPGETELVQLPDGSTITLAGGSRIELTGARAARLAHGQALFTIVHDDADPFVLLAGEDRLVDAGTVFDVKLGLGGLDLGVSEGAVVFNPGGADVRVDAGNRLASRKGQRIFVGRIDNAQVGEWLEGRLTFELATLDVVAEDLTRATGVRFFAVPGSSRNTVSGSLLIEPVERNPRSLESLLNVRVRRTADGWELAGR